jgi:TonB family protein
LPTPVYPSAARSVQAKGRVTIQVTIDQHGNVTSATPISGHPLLRSSAADAATRSRFNPVRISGQSVTAVGTIVYNFVNN